jgi:hypothetical protein
MNYVGVRGGIADARIVSSRRLTNVRILLVVHNSSDILQTPSTYSLCCLIYDLTQDIVLSITIRETRTILSRSEKPRYLLLSCRIPRIWIFLFFLMQLPK